LVASDGFAKSTAHRHDIDRTLVKQDDQ